MLKYGTEALFIIVSLEPNIKKTEWKQTEIRLHLSQPYSLYFCASYTIKPTCLVQKGKACNQKHNKTSPKNSCTHTDKQKQWQQWRWRQQHQKQQQRQLWCRRGGCCLLLLKQNRIFIWVTSTLQWLLCWLHNFTCLNDKDILLKCAHIHAFQHIHTHTHTPFIPPLESKIFKFLLHEACHIQSPNTNLEEREKWCCWHWNFPILWHCGQPPGTHTPPQVWSLTRPPTSDALTRCKPLTTDLHSHHCDFKTEGKHPCFNPCLTNLLNLIHCKDCTPQSHI